MSRFTIFAILASAIAIGGVQEMMRRNTDSNNQKATTQTVGDQSLGNSTQSNDPATNPNLLAGVNSPIAEPNSLVKPQPPANQLTVSQQTAKPSLNLTTEKRGPYDLLPDWKKPATDVVGSAAASIPSIPVAKTEQDSVKQKPPFNPDSISDPNLKPISAELKQEVINQRARLLEETFKTSDIKMVSPVQFTYKVAPFDEFKKHELELSVLKVPLDTPPTTEGQRTQEEEQQYQARLMCEGLFKYQLAHRSDQMDNSMRLLGKEVAMIDVLKMTNDRERRLRIVRAYWNLGLTMLEYHWSYFEESSLRYGRGELIATDTIQRKLLIAGYQASNARLNETRAAVISAQYELQSVAGLKELPIAIDYPMVGSYGLRLSTYFKGQSAPARYLALEKTIDLRRDTINSRAYAVNVAYSMFNAAITDNQGATRLDSQYVLMAYEQLAKHRRTFVLTVRDYNFDIADYVIAVLGNETPKALVDALIRKPNEAMLKQANDERDGPTLADQSKMSDSEVTQATFTKEANDGWGRLEEERLKSIMTK